MAKNGEHAGQPTRAQAKQSLRDAHVPRGLGDLFGARVERDVYFSTEQAARYTDRPSREAFIKWARRNGIALRRPKGGRSLVVRKADIDFALREER